jgi:hypothetical protein
MNLPASVVDPHWFQCESESSILSQCVSPRVWMTKKLKNYAAEKIIFFVKDCNFTYISLGLCEGRSSYRSLKPSKENTQHFETT